MYLYRGGRLDIYNCINRIWDYIVKQHTQQVALPTKNIKVINSFYKGRHDMQKCLRL